MPREGFLKPYYQQQEGRWHSETFTRFVFTVLKINIQEKGSQTILQGTVIAGGILGLLLTFFTALYIAKYQEQWFRTPYTVLSCKVLLKIFV
jgi:hypothetical protein